MTASAPEPLRSGGRSDPGAAVARTEELYARHGRLVSGLCHALLRDRAEAEDASQQTFLAAHRALLNGSSPREPAAWLATIARNECWSRIRSRMREPLPTAELDAESRGADPLTEAIRRADLAALWRAIGELPRQQRDALLLREFSGLTYDELAQALAVTNPAVESLLFRARQGVRSRLQTAAAAFSGASWIEALTRLLSGASISAAPIAAKAVVVAGVGAAVATGGVVVAPHVFDHNRAAPHRSVSAATRPAPVRRAPALAVRAPAPVAHQVFVAVTVAAHGGEYASSGDGSGSSSGSDGSGDRQGSAAAQPLKTDGRRRDASESGSQSSTDGGSSDGGMPQEAGDGAPPLGGDNGGGTVPAPNPPATVVGPPLDTSSSSGGDD